MREKAQTAEIKCSYCGLLFIRKINKLKSTHNFCSKECFNKMRSKNRETTYNCLNCGILKKTNRSSKNIYCSNKCMAAYIEKRNIQEWKTNSDSATNRAGGLAKYVKRYLMKKYNNCCCICGCNNVWNGKLLTLELDHIDGNHKNNNESNLRIVCPNCHSQTPNYKSKNRGNGRSYRRINS